MLVGSGGVGGTAPLIGSNGENSSAFGQVAIGGGAGGSRNGEDQSQSFGQDGGSGGGSGYVYSVSDPGGLGTPGQGNNGGSSTPIFE
jgi:hypothetical protein